MKQTSENTSVVKLGKGVTVTGSGGDIPQDHLVVIAAACATYTNRVVLKLDDSNLRRNAWVFSGRRGSMQ